MTRAEDMDLIGRVAEGDKAAMRALYERHHDALLAFVQSRGADADLASDVVHDTMLDVWKNAGRFRGTSGLRTWLCTIARNKFVDRTRRAAKMTLVDEVPERVDDTPSAEAVLEASQDAGRVRACLGKLNALQRSAIRLAFYEGLTYDEIAEVEGVPPGTVKSRIFHAKRALLKCLSLAQPVRVATP